MKYKPEYDVYKVFTFMFFACTICRTVRFIVLILVKMVEHPCGVSDSHQYIMNCLGTPMGQVTSVNERNTMEAITASNFRSSLASFLDKVTNDHEPVMVTRGDKQKAAVVISKEDYESLQETLYLFSSRSNADRLFSAFSQIDSGEAIERELIDENRKTDVGP